MFVCGGTRVFQFVLFFKLIVYPGTSTGKTNEMREGQEGYTRVGWVDLTVTNHRWG